MVDISRDGPMARGFAVVTPPPQFDLAVADTVRLECQAAIESFSGRLAVDLAEVEFIDSTALGVLVGAQRLARDVGGEVVLVGPGDRVSRLFQLTQLEDQFRTYQDFAELARDTS